MVIKEKKRIEEEIKHQELVAQNAGKPLDYFKVPKFRSNARINDRRNRLQSQDQIGKNSQPEKAQLGRSRIYSLSR